LNNNQQVLKSKGAMPVTLSQIAREVGLSHPTVSQILNDKGRLYNAETRAKVLQAAERLGYKPNGLARAMKRGRFGAIGLLMGTHGHASMVSRGTEWGIQQEAMRLDLHLITGQLPDEKLASHAALPKVLREWSVDGLIVSYNQDCPPSLAEMLAGARLPSIWLNSKREADCVYPDDLSAGRMAVEHLVENGCRRIGYMGLAAGSHYSIADRREGYTAAMRAAGLAPHVVSPANGAVVREEPSWGPVGMVEVARRALSAPDGPRAWITYGESEAAALLHAAAQLGLRPGRDLALVAIRAETAAVLDVRVTTVQINEHEVGRTAVDLLQAKMRGDADSAGAVAVPPLLIVGETSAAPGGETLD
jgi:LacI family transcriptional regulator